MSAAQHDFQELSSSLRDNQLHSLARSRRRICGIPQNTLIMCSLSFVLAIITIAVAVVVMHQGLPAFHERIEIDDILQHLRSFNEIANLTGGSRDIGSRGFNDSMDYVEKELRTNTHYEIWRQIYPARNFRLTTDPILERNTTKGLVSFPKDEFKALSFSGSGEAKGKVHEVPEDGCLAEHYDSSMEGHIVMIDRGNCSFAEKTNLAVGAGAIGVIIVSDGGAFTGTLGSLSNFQIPVIGVSKSLGEVLRLLDLGSDCQVSIRMVVTGEIREVVSQNLFAETKGGEEDSVIMVGAHLDSVADGPGINDNGSGSAGLLAFATHYYLSRTKPKNKVRFVWWGAEENDLVGSKFYIEDLKNKGELKNIALYLNMDMIGSPNGIRGINQGSKVANTAIETECSVIQTLFEQHFEEHEMTFDFLPFNGRSDYGPFINNSIPSGGVATGAEELKTDTQRAMFGGLALVPMDPCYHRDCDNLFNIDNDLLVQMTRAVARVAYDLSLEHKLREFITTPTPPEN